MIVVDKPRPKKRPTAVQHGDDETPSKLTARCLRCDKYTPMLKPTRITKGGVVMTTGKCACGRGTWRVGGAGFEAGAALHRRSAMNGCPQPGSGGIHSRRYYDEDRVCSWCGEKRVRRLSDIAERPSDEAGDNS